MTVLSTEQYNKLIQTASRKISALQSTVDKRNEPIAVVGMGCRFPQASNIVEYWNLLKNGLDGIQDRPEFHSYIDPYYDTDLSKHDRIYTRKGGFLDQHPGDFDAGFFSIPAIEARSLDPQHRLVLEVVWEALENAGIVPSSLAGSNTGIFVGICSNDYAWKLVKQETSEIDVYLGSGNAYSPVSGRISYLLDVHGPSFAIDTACSSSLTSTHIAVNSIRNGECDIAIVSGIQRYLSPEYWMNLCKSRILSPEGRCRSFSEEADGYVRGEGCGAIILKRLSQAQADNNVIYAVIPGSATGQDGKTSGLTVPNGVSQQEVIKKALKNANLTIEDIDYIEAHGTATPIGDPIEINALGNLFRKKKKDLYVGSVKSNIGHLEGSAGIAGLIKVILSLHNKQIPPNLHFKTPSSRIAWKDIPIKIVTELTDWSKQEKKRTAGVNSFGFEGVNTHVILEEAPKNNDTVSDNLIEIPWYAITLSAKSQSALNDTILNYAQYIEQNHELDIRDIAYTTNCAREHYKKRVSIVSSSKEDLLNKLQNNPTQEGSTECFISNNDSNNNIAFLFTGQGSQYSNMGHELYSKQLVFCKAMELCNQILLDKKLSDDSLLDIIYSQGLNKDLASSLDMTRNTQLALFMLEYSLSQLFLSLGVEPTAVLGHSVGEYVAACVAGIFSLEDALMLVANRGKLMQALPQNGSMVVVITDVDKIAPLVQNEPQVSIAAINGPNNIVLSGENAALDRIISTLKDVQVIPLQVSHAFHSPLMQPMLDEFRQVAEKVSYSNPNIDFISNLTGNIENTKPTTADYWCDHILGTVRFYDGILSLKDKADILLELGPSATLLGMSAPYASNDYTLRLPTILQGQSDWKTLMLSLAQLYSGSVNINWNSVYQGYNHQPATMPTYAWQRQRHWID